MDHRFPIGGQDVRSISLVFLLLTTLLFSYSCGEVQILGKWKSETAREHNQLVFKYKHDAVEVYTNDKLVGTGKWEYSDWRDEPLRINYNGDTWRANLSENYLSVLSKGNNPIVYKRVE